MSPVVHAVQGAAGAVALYPFFGYKSVIFGLSAVLIDLDHFIEYYLDTRRLDIGGLFKYHDLLLKNLDGYLGLNLFHTVECYAAIGAMGVFYPDAWLILGGFLFHHMLDQIQLIRIGRPFARAFSIVEYYIRKRHYFTTLHEAVEGSKKAC